MPRTPAKKPAPSRAAQTRPAQIRAAPSRATASRAEITPQRRTCACLQVHFGLLDRYPQFRINQARLEHETMLFVNLGTAAMRTGVTRIPVVVHVVYKTAAENISAAQVKSQISVLNKDFRARNTDVSKVPAPFKNLVADSRIEFFLASEDPNGNPTTGITRTQTDRASFPQDDSVKSSTTGGIEPWDTSKYLNIWVCRLASPLLGYAQFPGGPPETDGVVILNTAFGTSGSARAPFNKGRTTTHEVGHYLNLSHIWGESRFNTCDDGDFVDDTPNQFGPNGGTPTFPHISCNNGPDGDMFMNYMDYVDDKAMFMFTLGQVARMQACLDYARNQLGT